MTKERGFMIPLNIKKETADQSCFLNTYSILPHRLHIHIRLDFPFNLPMLIFRFYIFHCTQFNMSVFNIYERPKKPQEQL